MALHTIACVLFAGGKSSRMGKDKALLPFDNMESLAKYQYKRLEKIFERVYLSAKDADLFEHFDANVIEDEIGKDVYAPTSGFVNVFERLKTDNMIFVLSVDTPFVHQVIIDKLIGALDDNYDAIIVRTPGGIHPLCGIYSRTLEKPLLKMLQEDDHKLGKLLKNAKVNYIDIADEDALLNMNTPEDYDKALKILKEKN
jgi:molybdopterin-guanine dinucleotide biosynthesis protein A